MQFGSQRFRSRSVPYSAEPQWQDGVLLELPPPDEATAAAIGAAGVPEMATMERLRGLCRACEPIHVLVLHAVGGRERLLSSCMLEWRQVLHHVPTARHLPISLHASAHHGALLWQVLHHGRHTLALELPGVGAEATLPVGALELKLELLPRPRAEAAMTEAEVYLTIKRERDAQVEAERRFFAYARAWWQQYVELSPAHANRAVKLFALSELGTQRPVSAFVRPLRAARLLRSPRHAAHFVSLLRHRREPAAGNAVTDVWRSVHATLATRAGETEEHALLLCSLLLGFGLDAYVCLGADGRGSHVWVLTVGVDGARTFWESLTGLQYAVPGAAGHPYTELACVFNHRALYANTQPSVKLEHASLELEDPYAWKKMDAALLKSVTPLPQAPLRPCSMGEPAALEAATETALRALVDEHRASRGLGRPGVVWDEELSYLLTPALASYETERMTGHAAVDQTLFADAIRRKVSAGHTFKGFPHHFVTSDARSIFDTWLRDEVALSILQCRASKASLGLRLQLHLMADDIVSVWVMLAVAYKPEE
jgi:centrosomal protein CEP76